MYASSTPAEVHRLLEHSESTLLFVDTSERWAKLNSSDPSAPSLRSVVLLESSNADLPRSETVGLLSLDKIRQLGRQLSVANKDTFDQMVHSLRPQDDLTIVYTSGTTGEPKGVLTTHGHYLFMVEAAASAIPSIEEEVTFAVLAICSLLWTPGTLHGCGKGIHLWICPFHGNPFQGLSGNSPHHSLFGTANLRERFQSN